MFFPADSRVVRKKGHEIRVKSGSLIKTANPF